MMNRMGILELAEVYEKKYTTPLAHETSRVLMELNDYILMAKESLENGQDGLALHYLNKALRIKV